MHRIFPFVALLAGLTGPVLATPPSDKPKNSATALAPDDTEAWSNANKAKEALGKGLLERARVLAEKAESIKRTRETAYLRGSVELRSAMDVTKDAAEVLESYEKTVELGKPETRALGIAEQFLNLATARLDDAKLWQKEVNRLDASYKNLEFLSAQIKKLESNIEELDELLVKLKSIDNKREIEKGDVGDSNVKGDASFAELLSAGEWDTEYVASAGRSTRGKWHYIFAENGSFTATRMDLDADKFDRATSVASEYKGKWTIESRKLTRDEIRLVGRSKIRGTVPVLTVTLAENKAQYPFQDVGLKANGTFKAIVNTQSSTVKRVVFFSLYCDNLVFNLHRPEMPERPLILIHP